MDAFLSHPFSLPLICTISHWHKLEKLFSNCVYYWNLDPSEISHCDQMCEVQKEKKILFWLKEEEEWCQALPPHALQLSVPWIAWSQRRVLLKVSLVLAWLASCYLGKAILHPSFTKIESAGTGSGGLCLSNNRCNSQTCWTLRTGHGSTWQLPGDIFIQEKLLFL